MALTDALQEWEELWRATGAPVDELLAPGISADEVRAALGRDFVHPDVLTWFAWHNGAVGPWDAVPSGRQLYRLEALLQFQPIVKHSWEMVDPPDDEMQYRDSFFPVLDNDNNDTVLVDLDTGEVVRHELEPMVIDSPSLLLIGDDLESVVRMWIQVLLGLGVVTYVPGQYCFETDRARLPSDLVRRGIVIP